MHRKKYVHAQKNPNPNPSAAAPQTPSHARTRPRPLPHSLLSARPSLCDSAPRPSPPRAAPPLPLHRRGGRGPSPSTPDPAKSMAGAPLGGWIRRHHLHADDRADPIVSFVPPLLSSLVFVPNCILIARIGDHRASTTTTRRS